MKWESEAPSHLNSQVTGDIECPKITPEEIEGAKNKLRKLREIMNEAKTKLGHCVDMKFVGICAIVSKL